MSDGALWTVTSLLPFCSHEDDELRAWAVNRLGHMHDVAAAPVLVRALDDKSFTVVMKALGSIEVLGDAMSFDLAREPLRHTMRRADLPPGPTGAARLLLLKHGDTEAAEEMLKACLRGVEPVRAWLHLALHARGVFRKFVEDRGLLRSSTPEPLGATLLLPYAIELHELPAAYAKFAKLDDAEKCDTLMRACLWRCGAEHVYPPTAKPPIDFEEVLEDQGAAYPYEHDDARVLRWLSPGAFKPMLDAYKKARWPEVITWCARRCDEIGGDDDGGTWSRAFLRLLAAEKKPGERLARAAASLAVAAGERAIEREHPFASCRLEEQFARACGVSDMYKRARWSTVEARWRELSRDDQVRAEVEENLRATIEFRGGVACDQAVELAAKLARFPLTEAVFDMLDDNAERYAPKVMECLAAQPEALRALAPGVLDSGGEEATRAVLGALGRQNARWATEILRARFDLLIETSCADDFLESVRDLGDPSLLPEVLADWRAGETNTASIARHLALLGHRERELPAALVRDADKGRALMQDVLAKITTEGGIEEVLKSVIDAPLSVALECNRCKRSATYEPGRAIVHPDLEACRREGWDGVTFEEIVTCKFCGAEDDYTLGTKAMLSIMAGSLGAMMGGTKPTAEDLDNSRMVVGKVQLADGTLIRRASEALRHWERKTAARPDDAEAWLRLGNVLKRNRRFDEAIGAYRRVMELRPADLDAAGSLLHILLEDGRAHEGGDLVAIILKGLPGKTVSPDDRVDLAALVAEFLQAAAAAGQPMSLMASWPGEESHEEVTINMSPVDVRRVTRWERLAEFLARPDLISAFLKRADPEDKNTNLERLIEAGRLPVAHAGAKLISMSGVQKPVVRSEPKIGRNDPCHCGSGKKFKKCHGR